MESGIPTGIRTSNGRSGRTKQNRAEQSISLLKSKLCNLYDGVEKWQNRAETSGPEGNFGHHMGTTLILSTLEVLYNMSPEERDLLQQEVAEELKSISQKTHRILSNRKSKGVA